jgi:oligopeptide transport system substrate-binding protein
MGSGGWNFTQWADARYDALLLTASRSLEPAARLRELQAAEARLLEEMPVIPIAFERTLRLVHPSVRDWPLSTSGRPDYRPVWLAPP